MRLSPEGLLSALNFQLPLPPPSRIKLVISPQKLLYKPSAAALLPTHFRLSASRRSIQLMARSMPLVAALLLVSAAVLAVAPRTAEALTCGNVVTYLAPCILYARGASAAPTASCCNGVRNLNAAAKTKADRQTACTCLKSTVASVSGIKFNIVSGIPGKCGVTVPYPISTSVDCSKVE